MKQKITKAALSIFLTYLLIGFLYIYFSDTLVYMLFPENVQTIQTIKGWGFIFVSGLLILILINRQILKRNRINDDLQRKNDEYYALYEEYLALNEELAEANNYLQQSEEKFRSFVENANDIVYSVNPEGVFTYVSPNWKEMLGHEPEEVTGKPIANFIHPDDMHKCMDFLHLVLQTSEKQSGVEYRAKHKNGTWRWHHSNGAPVRNNNGDLAYMGIARDVTERREMVTRLQEQNTFIQTVLNNLPIGVALNKFNEGTATYINQKFEEIYGWDKKHLKDIPAFFEKVFPDKTYRERMQKQIMEDIQSGNLQRMRWNNLTITCEDGSQKIINAVNIPLIEQNTMISTVMDVTAQKKAEKEIQEVQKRLERAEQVAHFGNWEFNMNTKTVISSFGAKKIYGLFHEEIALSEAQLVPLPEYRDMLDHALENLIKNNTPYDVRFKIKRVNDDQIRDIHSIAEFDKHRNVVFGVMQDITELSRAEERFRNYIQNSPTAVLIVDSDGQYTFVNPAACHLLGYSEKEFLEMSITDITGNSFDKNGTSTFHELKEKGVVKSTGTSVKRKDNRIIDLSIDAVKLSDDEYIAFCRNITDLKNTQRELEENLKKIQEINNDLEKAKQIAEENDRLKTAFLNNMSHEIRTPMNGILGFSELLTAENLSKDKKQKYAKVIKSSGNQLLHIIDDILDISRLEAGQLSLVEEVFHLNDVIDLISSLTENQIKNRQKRLQLKVKKGLPDHADAISGDKARIMQILTNLTVNAVKFTEVGYVELGYDAVEDNLKLYVKDSGLGIPPEMHHTIFERFQQTEDTVKNVHGGTGLGLSIVKGLVDLMNGTILLNSTPGVGSTFTVILPYHKRSINENSIPRSTDSKKDFGNKTILIVEDDPSSYELLKEFLENYNVNIHWASNGGDAISFVANEKNLDIILMDIRMPGTDGYEAMKKIKTIHPEIPIIAQTAYAMHEEKTKAYEAGCDDYITKPIDQQTLMELLKAYL